MGTGMGVFSLKFDAMLMLLFFDPEGGAKGLWYSCAKPDQCFDCTLFLSNTKKRIKPVPNV